MSRSPLGSVTVTFENGVSFSGDGTVWDPPYFVMIKCDSVHSVSNGNRANLRCADGTGWDNLVLNKTYEVIEDHDEAVEILGIHLVDEHVHKEEGTYVFTTDSATRV